MLLKDANYERLVECFQLMLFKIVYMYFSHLLTITLLCMLDTSYLNVSSCFLHKANA